MENAVIITGHLRTFESVMASINDSIIQPNNAVVFICCETDDYTKLQEILNTFPLIKIGGIITASSFRNDEFNAILTMTKTSQRKGLSDAVFERARNADGLNWSINYIETSGSLLQYYQFWKIWQILLAYERTHKCKFENIIRTRTDIFINKPINMQNVFEEDGYINTLYKQDAFVKNSVYFDKLINSISHPDDTIITLGNEQVWFGNRCVFNRIAHIVFHYGLWDSGHSFSFNSETAFHEFCKNHNIYHIGLEEKNWPVYFYNDTEKKTFLFGICRK